MEIKNLRLSLLELQEKIKNSFDQAKKEILELPDNENISRFPNAPNVFTVQLSELNRTKNWCPEWHDYKYQYDVIAYALESSDNFLSKLELICKNGKVKTDKHGYVTFNPKVIDYLKQILY